MGGGALSSNVSKLGSKEVSKELRNLVCLAKTNYINPDCKVLFLNQKECFRSSSRM